MFLILEYSSLLQNKKEEIIVACQHMNSLYKNDALIEAQFYFGLKSSSPHVVSGGDTGSVAPWCLWEMYLANFVQLRSCYSCPAVAVMWNRPVVSAKHNYFCVESGLIDGLVHKRRDFDALAM